MERAMSILDITDRKKKADADETFGQNVGRTLQKISRMSGVKRLLR